MPVSIIFSDKLADLICDRIADGASLRMICHDSKIPSRRTVMRWLADPGRADFRRSYELARDAFADRIFGELLDIADDAGADWVANEDGNGNPRTNFDHEHVQRARLRIDTRRWVCARMAPWKYSDRARKVQLDLPELKSAADIATAHVRVVKAVSSGEVDLDVAAGLMAVLGKASDSIAVADLETRITALETRNEK
jgi:hypothetical protein